MCHPMAHSGHLRQKSQRHLRSEESTGSEVGGRHHGETSSITVGRVWWMVKRQKFWKVETAHASKVRSVRNGARRWRWWRSDRTATEVWGGIGIWWYLMVISQLTSWQHSAGFVGGKDLLETLEESTGNVVPKQPVEGSITPESFSEVWDPKSIDMHEQFRWSLYGWRRFQVW